METLRLHCLSFLQLLGNRATKRAEQQMLKYTRFSNTTYFSLVKKKRKTRQSEKFLTVRLGVETEMNSVDVCDSLYPNVSFAASFWIVTQRYHKVLRDDPKEGSEEDYLTVKGSKQ